MQSQDLFSTPAGLAGTVIVIIAICLLLGVMAYRSFKGNHDLPIWPALLVIVAVIGTLSVTSGPSEAERWAAFKVEHKCVVVEKREGYSTGGVGITTSGHMAVMTGGGAPDQTAYRCDDGVVYWKNE
ncbi:hypothetical protein R088_24555 [Salmonella enterica subsp. enterica serovar Heidelberg]|nr:hypothetical protein [Salmonella enterica subsp. enterica serovar Heidelberg]EEK2418841.1 hypothetical protein [Salmonella enterica subsp. enterica serovar Heidelberg]